MPTLVNCECEKYCRGGKKVSKATFFRHAPYRTIIPEFNLPSDVPGDSGRGRTLDISTGVDKHREIDHGMDAAPIPDDFEVVNTNNDAPPDQGEGTQLEPTPEPNVQNKEVDGNPVLESDDEDSDGGYSNTLDPGCVFEQQQLDSLQQRSASPHSQTSQPQEGPAEPDNFAPPSEIQDLFAPSFVPQVEELKDPVDFIRALRTASLDNGDLQPDALARLRNPPTYVLEIDDRGEIYSLQQFLATLNASQQTYTDFRENHNNMFPDVPMLSFQQVRHKLAEWSGVNAIIHDMCPNTCIAYTGPFSNLEKCPKCALERYETNSLQSRHGRTKVPLQRFYTLPLGPQIQALWRSPQGASKMKHRRNCTREIVDQITQNNGTLEHFEDIYHGAEYLNAVLRGDISPTDTLVMFSMDGAQLYHDKQSDCWIYIWIILELAPDLRYKKKHVLPGGFIPGPNNPKHTESFLFPGFNHVAALQKEGLHIWDAMDDQKFVSFIFYLLGLADGPGSVHLTGLVGHHGGFPCRLFCGIQGRNKPGGSHHYPALLRPYDYDVAGSDHPDIDVKSIHSSSSEYYDVKLQQLLQSRNPSDYKTRRRDTGISRPSLIHGLPANRRLPFTSTLCGDCMHVSTLNLGDLLLPLWRGTFDCAGTDSPQNWPWAVLKGDVWKNHGEAVANARPWIPGSFDRPPRNIAEKIHSGYKAKEWQGYLYGLAPALLYNILPKSYWQNFCKLVFAVRIILQRSISLSQLLRAQEKLDEFHIEFEELYVARRTDRLHMVRPCMHALLHMGLQVPRLGPPGLHSTWTMERTIGDLGREIRQPSNPYANLSERGLIRSQVNALKSMLPALESNTDQPPRGSQEFRNGYVLLRARERRPTLCTANESRAINNFLAAGLSEDESPPAGVFSIRRWARLRIPTGQIARSAWKENLKQDHKLRRARCVKLKRNEQIEFAEVHFYFQITEQMPLAMVSLYSRADPTLYEESYGTVYSVTMLPEEEGLCVIPAGDIISVVSMQPHEHKDTPEEQWYFVWEYIGLQVGLLGGNEEPLQTEE